MEEDHWIQWVWAKNQDGTIVAVVKLAATDTPELTFDVPEGTTSITGFESCNKHGVWKSDDVSV
jgi:desulfoferrodoxin (superoxide reductase-like protein)